MASSSSGDAKALAIYQNLRRDGLQPSISIALAALKVCAASKSLSIGVKIHRDLGDRWSGNVYIANNLIAMYARCGSMANACQVFRSMEQRDRVDLVSWNSMIQGYCDNGEFELALLWFNRLEECGRFQPDGRSVVPALKSCSFLAAGIEKKNKERLGKEEDLDDQRKALLEKVRAIHRKVSCSSFRRDGFVANALIESYGRCGSLEEAVLLFESIEADLVSWTTIVVQCVENGEPTMALEFFDRMGKEDAVADQRIFVAVLKACEALIEEEREAEETQEQNGGETNRYLEKIRKIHSRALESSGPELDLFLRNTLVGAYARAGSLDDAREVFDSIQCRDVVSWTKMVLGYVEAGKPELALELYSRMRNDGSILPSEVTVVATLKACSSLALDEEAKLVNRELVKIESLEKGMAVHSDQARFLSRDNLVANSLVDFYSRCKASELARWVFDDIENRTAASWNSMIMGYVENDNPEVALELYAAMQNEEEDEEVTLPNKVTVLAALKACRIIAAREENRHQKEKVLERVTAVHSQALRLGIGFDTQLGSSLVETYAKCGSMVDARSVFQQMKTRDTVAWNSLILAYVESGADELGMDSYLEMKLDCCLPNRGTYLAALKVCGNLAALDTGKAIHEELRAAKLDGDTKVVNALVDFYGKCGSLAEAQQVFNDLPVQSRNLVTWNSLLAAYRHAGRAGEVIKLLETMIQHKVEPDSVTYVSVLSACNQAGLVEQGKFFFEAMSSEFGIQPSIEHCSCWIDLLCRVNRIDEAVKVVKESATHSPSFLAKLWMAILCACYKSSNVEIARIAFKAVMELDDQEAVAYVLMANMEL